MGVFFGVRLSRFGWAIAIFVGAWVGGRASGAEPEYIAVEAPPAASLRDARDATQNIGISEREREISFLLEPSRMLPQLRELIPDTGIPFFDEARFTIAPRSYYRLRDNGDGTKSEAFTIGGAIRVESGWLWDFAQVGLAGYNSTKLYGPAGRDGTGLLRPGQGGYTVLGQVYLNLQTSRTFGTVGRQRVDAPYINANDSRMTPSTFEAITLGSTDLGNFQLGAGHVTRIRFRDQSSFEYLSDFAGAEDTKKGVTAAGLRYNFTDDTYIGVMNQYGWDMYNTFYGEAERFFPIGDEFSFRISTQFTDQRSVGEEILGAINVQQAGARLSAEYGALIGSGSFVWTARGSAVRNPWGGSPSYNAVMISDFDRAGEKSIRLALQYDFSHLGLQGLSFNTSWLAGDTPDSGADASPDQREFNITVDYQPTDDWYQDIWFRVRWAKNDRKERQGGLDRTDFRVILNYSVAF
ncbi:MAG: OprD family outer membrane porin [Verrucomicrobiota bacterium]